MFKGSCVAGVLYLSLAHVAFGAANYADFRVIGTGADAGISFEFLANVTLLTSGFQSGVSFVSCTVPTGETCSQFGYGPTGGQVRLTTLSGGTPVTRTWFFPALLHSGVYIAQTGAGVEPGYIVVSGAEATAGQPQSNATNATFQFPLEVTVTDSTPFYQSGVTVTFTAPGSGPSASLPSGGLATTDNTGRARLTPTANGTPGAYQITATADVGGNTFQTSFVLANVNTANASGACQVTTVNDDFSSGSLRYQVAACGQGGTITFAPGITTVNLETGQDIPLTQDLTIDGGSGVAIDGNGRSRIFFITGGTITLKNLTLQNGGAAGGAGGAGSIGAGGGAAGMGGAIFVNAGSLVINNVTFTGNVAVGGDGGPFDGSFRAGGGGGVGGPGGTTGAGINGNGAGGGDFGSSGGGGTGSSINGSGDGAGGGNGGNGAFAGGGASGGPGGAGGFGGGGGGWTGSGGIGGTFAGSGASVAPLGGGGGAGLGGAIFMRNGTLSLTNATFTSNTARGGAGQNGGGNGQGKGGALYISSTASATSSTALPAFNSNLAASAGTGTVCNTVVGSNALDTNDICGTLVGPATHFSVSAPATAQSYTGFSVTVTALDAHNNVATGYTGTVHLTSTDPGFTNGAGDSILVNGTGTFNVGMKQAGVQTITATDTVNSSITGTSNSITVTPGPATSFRVSAPASVSFGSPFSFTVTATDLYGNSGVSFLGPVTFTSTDPAAVLPASYTFTAGDAGTHSFTATLNTHGSFTISASGGSITGTSGNIAVPAPPTISQSFNPTAVEVGGNSTLTITITNPNSVALSNVQFSDTMPAGLTLVTQTGGTCSTLAGTNGGTISIVAPTFSSTSNSLAAGASCNVTFQVRGSTTGSKVNTTSAITATESGAGLTASATLTVNADAPPGISESFTPTTISAGSTSQLSFTLTNPNTTISLTGVAFTDTLPSGLAVASPNGLTGSCGGGTISATAGSGSISLANATLAAGTPCTFSINVQASSAGAKVNTTSAITSTEGGAGLSATASLTVTAGAATHFTVSAPATAIAGTAFNFTVTALDQFNNAATGYTGTVHFSSSDGFGVLPADSTLTNGVGTFSATLKTAGSRTLTATDASTGTISGTSNAVAVSSAAATHFTVSAPATATAGTAFNFTVTAQDQFNNTATGYSGAVHFTTSDVLATVPADSTLTNGAGTFSATLKTVGNRTLTATDAASGTISGTSNAIAVSSAAATHFTVSAPATATAGTAFNFTVTAQDQFNNTASGYTGPVHFTSSDGLATVPANSTLTNGVGTFSATLRTAGKQTLTGIDAVTSTIAGTSNAIALSSAAATHFAVSAPPSATAGAAFNFTVTALDQFNNTATGYTGAVHFTSTDAGATLPANSNLTNGVGTFTVALRTAGAQTISALDTINASITGASNPIAVSAGAALRFVVSAPAAATAGTAFNFTVTALDQFNNTATGYTGTLHFTSSDSKAVLPADSILIGGTGTLSATLKTAGIQTITATDASTASMTGTSGAVTVSPGSPASIKATGSSAQSTQIYTAFGTALAVLVTDQSGNPISGVAVTFTAPESGPSAAFMGAAPGATATAATNAQGIAAVNPVANGITGTFTVTAAAAGQTVSFTLTNTVPPPLNPRVDPAFLILHYTQGAAPDTAALNVTSDQPSTYSAAVTVPWLTVSPASGLIGPSAQTVTVSGNGESLAPGLYSTNVVFTFGDGTGLVVPVQLYVAGPPQFKPDAAALSFTAQAGSTAVQTQGFIMRSAGADFAAALTVTDVSGNGGGRLTVTPSSFTTPAQIQVQVNPAGLAPGVYQKNIVFTGAASNSPYTVAVTLTITPTAPEISVASVVNGASFAPGPAAPNTIVTAFGSFPGCMSNAHATVDGAAVDVFYSSPTQISLLIPSAVASEAAAQLQISCAGLTAPAVSVPIAATGPALFTVAQNGTGQADVVNQDGSIDMSSPAGAVIELYGTGFGILDPPGPDGLMHLAQTVTATVGGIPTQVLYAGQAPGYTFGLQQIDILIPADAASGATLPLQLTIGGVNTQSGLTLAIK